MVLTMAVRRLSSSMDKHIKRLQNGGSDDVGKVRGAMMSRDVKKIPGFSYMEVNGAIFKFSNGDKGHPNWRQIYWKLEEICFQLRDFGCDPQTNFVLHDIGDEEKEYAFCYLSEKLAVWFD